MPVYVVLTKLRPQARKNIDQNPDRFAEVDAQVKKLGARVLHQYVTLGEHDVFTIIEAPDNAAVASIGAEISTLGTLAMETFPAVEMDRFQKLLKIEPYRTEPHRWQTSAWARVVRRAGRPFVVDRYIKRYCRPFAIEGREQLRDFRGGAIVIANHSSHFDTPVALSALPSRISHRVLVAAAADKFYAVRRKHTWWYSLFMNTFPVQRGGGTKQLEYPLSLLRNGWSILIYPEGGRSKSGQVQKFKHGVTIMAMQASVPVIPIYVEGLRDVMPKGQRTPRPAAVSARIGPPVSLEGVESVPDGTALLENAMRALARMPPHRATAPAAAEAAAQPTGGGS
jgi:1-acyl-sn-glycerol-3-phosphate acyltransferase